MKVKICGMKYPDNILEVSSLLYGIYLWENHRGILMVSSLLYCRIKKVGVLLMKHSYYYPKVLKHDLQVVQLHGKESVDFLSRNQLPKGIEIIKVFSIQDEFDFSALKPSKSSAIIFYLILENYLEETEQLSIGQY
jgi:phosphoribosylanthranilate isomerase